MALDQAGLSCVFVACPIDWPRIHANASWSACGKPGRDAAFAGRTAGQVQRKLNTSRKRCRRCRLAPCISATALQDAVAWLGCPRPPKHTMTIFNASVFAQPQPIPASRRLALHPESPPVETSTCATISTGVVSTRQGEKLPQFPRGDVRAGRASGRKHQQYQQHQQYQRHPNSPSRQLREKRQHCQRERDSWQRFSVRLGAAPGGSTEGSRW